MTKLRIPKKEAIAPPDYEPADVYAIQAMMRGEANESQQKRVLDSGIAWIMTDILKDTTQPSKDFIFGSWTNIGRVAALKTGTTDNLKDVYSVGYVPTLVTGVWMGNSNGDRMSTVDFASATGPGSIPTRRPSSSRWDPTGDS